MAYLHHTRASLYRGPLKQGPTVVDKREQNISEVQYFNFFPFCIQFALRYMTEQVSPLNIYVGWDKLATDFSFDSCSDWGKLYDCVFHMIPRL